MKKLALVLMSLFLIFFSLSCSKDEDSHDFLDPTENVALTVRFNFQYFSSDISLKKVSAHLKSSEESSSVIVSNSDNVNGQPDYYDLILKVSGQAAKDIIGETIYISSKVVFNVNGEERNVIINRTGRIHGGQDIKLFHYELTSVKDIEVIVTSYFTYNQNHLVLNELYVNLYEDENPYVEVARKQYKKINDRPEKIVTSFILEGVMAEKYLGKKMTLEVRPTFYAAGWFSYSEYIPMHLQEGVQEFEVSFSP